MEVGVQGGDIIQVGIECGNKAVGRLVIVIRGGDQVRVRISRSLL